MVLWQQPDRNAVRLRGFSRCCRVCQPVRAMSQPTGGTEGAHMQPGIHATTALMHIRSADCGNFLVGKEPGRGRVPSFV